MVPSTVWHELVQQDTKGLLTSWSVRRTSSKDLFDRVEHFLGEIKRLEDVGAAAFLFGVGDVVAHTSDELLIRFAAEIDPEPAREIQPSNNLEPLSESEVAESMNLLGARVRACPE